MIGLYYSTHISVLKISKSPKGNWRDPRSEKKAIIRNDKFLTLK